MKTFCIIETKGGHVQNMTPFTKFLRELKDGRHILEAAPYNRRTNQQNKYLHAVLIPEFRKALNGVGYNEVKTNEQAKLVMKSMFLTRQVPNETGGKPVHFVQDTSALTKEELGILIEEVIQFAAENMNYQIMYPNEQALIDYE